MIQLSKNISKDDILKVVSQEQLFEYYLKGACIIGGRINSPLRKDDCPSFSLFYNRKGDIYWKDFGSGKYGDIWNLVMELYGLTYYQVIVQVYKDMILGLSPVQSAINNNNSSYVIKPRIQTINKIDVEYQDFNLEDYKWWKENGISDFTLDYFNVKVAKRVYYNGNIWLNYKKSSPIYVYQEEGEYKFYLPKNGKSYKWYGNMKADKIIGLSLIPDNYNQLIIWNKSFKDVMSVYENLGIMGFSLASEGIITNQNHIDKIYSKSKNIFVLGDYDLAGVRQVNYLYKKWALGNYGFMTTDRQSRRMDYTDYYKTFGKEEANIRLQNLLVK